MESTIVLQKEKIDHQSIDGMGEIVFARTGLTTKGKNTLEIKKKHERTCWFMCLHSDKNLGITFQNFCKSDANPKKLVAKK